MDKKTRLKKFNKILLDINAVKIQGAKNIAKAALVAYFLIPGKNSIKKLISGRPTEPMLKNVLSKVSNLEEGNNTKEIFNHFEQAQSKMNEYTTKIIKNNDIIFTHCHSTNVSRALIYAKKHGKKFSVYNTETRPLFQGRKTALELEKSGIKVTMFIDSAVDVALSDKKVKKIFLGADALIKKGVINKIGSKTIAEIALIHKIPVYIIADSWKFTKDNVPIEERKLNEVWDKAPKKIKIQNPAFEFVPKKYIKKIISELGILNYGEFLKRVVRAS